MPTRRTGGIQRPKPVQPSAPSGVTRRDLVGRFRASTTQAGQMVTLNLRFESGGRFEGQLIVSGDGPRRIDGEWRLVDGRLRASYLVSSIPGSGVAFLDANLGGKTSVELTRGCDATLTPELSGVPIPMRLSKR